MGALHSETRTMTRSCCRTERPTTRGKRTDSLRLQTSCLLSTWARSCRSKVLQCLPYTQAVSLLGLQHTFQTPRQRHADFSWHVVVMESQLLPNSKVTEDLFMEAYKMAVERNNGKFSLSYLVLYTEWCLWYQISHNISRSKKEILYHPKLQRHSSKVLLVSWSLS